MIYFEKSVLATNFILSFINRYVIHSEAHRMAEDFKLYSNIVTKHTINIDTNSNSVFIMHEEKQKIIDSIHIQEGAKLAAVFGIDAKSSSFFRDIYRSFIKMFVPFGLEGILNLLSIRL